MARKTKAKIDIDVLPYLSIMLSVLGIICLIIVVMVMNIALNPKAIAIVSFKGLFAGSQGGGAGTGPVEVDGASQSPKIPSYLDCSAGGVSLFPGETNVLPAELMAPDNAVKTLLDKVEANSSNEYVIVLIRPGSLPVYRAIRKMLADRNIDIAYDTLEATATIDWRKEAKELNITLPK
jgi:hypothetical protein